MSDKPYLKRLLIKQFRNVRPGTEIFFNPGYNILLGKNGTGKTTLLEIISCFMREDFFKFKNDLFEIEIEIKINILSLIYIIKNQTIDDPNNSQIKEKKITVDTQHILNDKILPTNDPSWFNNPSDRGFFMFVRDFKTNFGIVHYLATDKNLMQLFIENINNLNDTIVEKIRENLPELIQSHYNTKNIIPEEKILKILKHKTETFKSFFGENFIDYIYLYNIYCNNWIILGFQHLQNPFERFDESLNIFNRLVDSNDPYRIRAEITFNKGSSMGSSMTAHFLSPSLLEILPASQDSIGKHFIVSNQNQKIASIEMLDNLIKMLNLKNAEIVFDGNIINELGKKKVIYDAMKFNIYYPNGDEMDHNSLSYGQKRLLAFLYYIECNESMIIADEMSNGFHYDWIKECMDLIKDRQCFLSSQNPILLDHLSFEDKSEIQHTFVKCEFDEQYRIVWSNFTDDDVDDFWGAYQVKIQEVSEILRAKGLW